MQVICERERPREKQCDLVHSAHQQAVMQALEVPSYSLMRQLWVRFLYL